MNHYESREVNSIGTIYVKLAILRGNEKTLRDGKVISMEYEDRICGRKHMPKGMSERGFPRKRSLRDTDKKSLSSVNDLDVFL